MRDRAKLRWLNNSGDSMRTERRPHCPVWGSKQVQYDFDKS